MAKGEVRSRRKASASKPEKKGSKVSRKNQEAKHPPSPESKEGGEAFQHFPGSPRVGHRVEKGIPFSRAAAQWLKRHARQGANASDPGVHLDNTFLSACTWHTRIGDVRCDAFEIEREDEEGDRTPGIRVIVVPGNPGVCSFYVRFAKMIYESLGRKVSVSAVSYMGFLTEPEDAMLVTLAEERAYLISLLQELHKRDPAEKFVLVGHSIGAWLCTEAMKFSADLPVVETAMIFPFVCMGRDKMRKQDWLDTRNWPSLLRPLLDTAFYMASRAGSGFKMLPDFHQRLLLRFLEPEAAQDDLCSGVTLEYLAKRPHIMRSVFHLGRTELNSLPRPAEPDAAWAKDELASYKPISSKLSWLYTDNDNWAPLEQAEEVRSALPKSHVEVQKGVSHAFTQSEGSDAKVAKFVCGMRALRSFKAKR